MEATVELKFSDGVVEILGETYYKESLVRELERKSYFSGLKKGTTIHRAEIISCSKCGLDQ